MKEPVSRLTEAALEVLDRHVDGRAARWAEHRMSRREQLIDAAVAAVKQYGSNVGIEQIAATARTSKPVIYRYFADKGELYRAVGERVIAQVVSALRGVLAGSDPQALLRASIDAYLELLEENPELFRFVTQLNGGAPADAEFSRPVVDVLTAALGEQLRSIGLDPAGARRGARRLSGSSGRPASGGWTTPRRSPGVSCANTSPRCCGAVAPACSSWPAARWIPVPPPACSPR